MLLITFVSCICIGICCLITWALENWARADRECVTSTNTCKGFASLICKEFATGPDFSCGESKASQRSKTLIVALVNLLVNTLLRVVLTILTDYEYAKSRTEREVPCLISSLALYIYSLLRPSLLLCLTLTQTECKAFRTTRCSMLIHLCIL